MLAVLLGVYVYRRGDDVDSTPKTSAIASAAGVACTLFVLVVLLLGTEPDGVDLDFGELLKPVIAVTIGTSAAGGTTAYALEHWLDL